MFNQYALDCQGPTDAVSDTVSIQPADAVSDAVSTQPADAVSGAVSTRCLYSARIRCLYSACIRCLCSRRGDSYAVHSCRLIGIFVLRSALMKTAFVCAEIASEDAAG